MLTGPFAFIGPVGTGDRSGCRISGGKFARGRPQKLVAQLELFGDGGVPFHVRVVKIIEQAAALTNHHQKAAAGAVVFFVALQVLGQMVDTLGEQRDLHVSGTSVLFVQLK
jgi:hypothetical protein